MRNVGKNLMRFKCKNIIPLWGIQVQKRSGVKIKNRDIPTRWYDYTYLNIAVSENQFLAGKKTDRYLIMIFTSYAKEEFLVYRDLRYYTNSFLRAHGPVF